jgi:hypothetical protein
VLPSDETTTESTSSKLQLGSINEINNIEDMARNNQELIIPKTMKT